MAYKELEIGGPDSTVVMEERDNVTNGNSKGKLGKIHLNSN